MELDKGSSKNATIESKLKHTTDESSERLAYFKLPKACYVILLHELLERFSFYGTSSILALYLTGFIKLTMEDATLIYHLFTALANLSPLIGAIVGDNYLSRHKTILIFGFIYLIGHITLTGTAHKSSLSGPFLGLFLLAIGSGAIKSNVVTFGADQITGKKKAIYSNLYFSLFYSAISIGSFFAQISIPLIRSHTTCFDRPCYILSFAVPMFAFLLAYMIFIEAQPLYKHDPCKGNIIFRVLWCYKYAIGKWYTHRKASNDSKSSIIDYAEDEYDVGFIQDVKDVMSTLVMFIPFPFFWAVHYQTGSLWTFQAEKMDGYLFSKLSIEPEQMQGFNTLFIIILIPLFDVAVYPFLESYKMVRSKISRISLGYMFGAAAALYCAVLQLKMKSDIPFVPAGRGNIRVVNAYGPNMHSINNLNILPDQKSDVPYGHASVAYALRAGVDDICVVTTNDTFSLNIDIPRGNFTTYFVVKNPLTDTPRLITGFIDTKIKGGNPKVRVLFDQNNPFSQSIVSVVANMQNCPDKKFTLYDRSKNSDLNFDHSTIDRGNYMLSINTTNGITILYKDMFTIDKSTIYTFVLINHVNKVEVLLIKELHIETRHMMLQIPMYFLLSCGEILFSITAMAYAYAEAPESMKSTLQAAYLWTVFTGNMIVVMSSKIPGFIDSPFNSVFYSFILVISGVITYIMGKVYFKNHRKEVVTTTTTGNENLQVQTVSPKKKVEKITFEKHMDRSKESIEPQPQTVQRASQQLHPSQQPSQQQQSAHSEQQEQPQL